MELITKGLKYHKDITLPFIIARNNSLEEVKNYSDRYKIILINKGKFIAVINSKNCFIKDQSIIILNEKDVISFEKRNNIDYYIVYFHPGVINAKFNFDNIKKQDPEFNETDGLDLYTMIPFINDSKTKLFYLNQLVYKKIEKLFLSIENNLKNQNDEFWPCKSRSSMIELLYILRIIYEEKSNYKNLELEDIDDNISRVILYIHSNYEKKITIEELSKTFYTNRTTLSNKFKEKTGLSIIDYINKLRIDIACQMLRDTNCTIEDIADRTGFTDISNFGRAFRKYTDLTPTKYKTQFDKMKYFNSHNF